jgi:hypothetical protein
VFPLQISRKRAFARVCARVLVDRRACDLDGAARLGDGRAGLDEREQPALAAAGELRLRGACPKGYTFGRPFLAVFIAGTCSATVWTTRSIIAALAGCEISSGELRRRAAMAHPARGAAR